MVEWSPDDLSKDEAHRLLADERRRVALRLLLNERETWELDSLARAIVAREEDVPPEAVDEDEHERVFIALKHRDVPKLADANVVEYDEADDVVRTDENIDDLDPLV